jgi:hypothetical protein
MIQEGCDVERAAYIKAAGLRTGRGGPVGEDCH